MTQSTGSFVTHLEGAIDGAQLPARTLQSTHEGRPIWVRYDLERIREAVSRDDLTAREQSMWRYRELLPVAPDDERISLGEVMSPIVDCPRLARELGVAQLFIKDESVLPTGSFKARGMAMAVTMAKALGVKRIALPTAGNAGGAAAAYAARAGLECFVFMPEDTPIVNRLEAALFGAKAYLVNGLIHECGALVNAGREHMGWFDLSTLKEPYRLEGKKTMGLELAEQFDWDLPEVIFYPTGGGTGLIGMWKAFRELGQLGWLAQRRLAGGIAPRARYPRLFSCQSTGCAPIADAYERGERFAEPAVNPNTIASGLRVPKAVGDFMILDAVRESGGRAMAAEEATLIDWMRKACALEGISLCPESAACLACAKTAVERGWIDPAERVVVFNTGAAQKYVEAMQAGIDLPRLDKNDVDWHDLSR